MQTYEPSDLILERLTGLHPKMIDLSLERMRRLLAVLGNPERQLPPVFHIAGTNGKGSTAAYLRACLEAGGYSVHAYTSPHLVRFHERIRLAGELITEEELAALLEECERANKGESITFFEITTVTALMAFARHRADALVLEVGMGGRLDTTNIIEKAAVTIITPVDLDHQAYLGNTITEIAREKAGILKPGVVGVIGPQSDEGRDAIEAHAQKVGAPLLIWGQDFSAMEENGRLVYQDEQGLLDLPHPRLVGAHQIENAGTAICALRHAIMLPLEEDAIARGLKNVEWLARMQRLKKGPLVAQLPDGAEIWLDGGHNPQAGRAVAAALRDLNRKSAKPLILIAGMLEAKDARGFFDAFNGLAQATITIGIPDAPASLSAEALAQAARDAGLDAETAETLDAALVKALRRGETPPRILICGSLYLAGNVLRENG
jgi:dihydrofolate synthase/folylpolyglutamate synthase